MNCRHRCRLVFLCAWIVACFAPWILVSGAPGPREQALAEFTRQTESVAYEYGACTPQKMDCSCFVQRLYTQKFARPLPRTTLAQADWLSDDRVPGLDGFWQLNPGNLCPGDLIYTYSGSAWDNSPRHVVVYLGAGHVLHSSAGRRKVVTDPLKVLNSYRLHGVYRPLGCSDQPPASGTTTVWRVSRRAGQEDQKAIRRLVAEYFATWRSGDVQAYRRLWHRDASQWSQGSRLDLEEIVNRCETELDGLRSARPSHEITSLAVFGEHALVEVEYHLERTYLKHQRADGGVKESFVLRRSGGGWLIAHNESYRGD